MAPALEQTVARDSEDRTTDVGAAVDHYVTEGRAAGLDDAALLAILQARLSRRDG